MVADKRARFVLPSLRQHAQSARAPPNKQFPQDRLAVEREREPEPLHSVPTAWDLQPFFSYPSAAMNPASQPGNLGELQDMSGAPAGTRTATATGMGRHDHHVGSDPNKNKTKCQESRPKIRWRRWTWEIGADQWDEARGSEDPSLCGTSDALASQQRADTRRQKCRMLALVAKCQLTPANGDPTVGRQRREWLQGVEWSTIQL